MTDTLQVYDHEPINLTHQDVMRTVASVLDDAFNSTETTARAVGFILLVFPFNQPDGVMHCVHNGVPRQSVIDVLKQQIERLEASGEKVS